MPKLKVKLDAYVLPDDHAIFKVSPGKTYRFYQQVRKANAIFLDIRGLDDVLGANKAWDDQAVLDVIVGDRWARELVSREKGNEPKGTEEVSRVDRTRLNFLKTLLGEAKKGDLVIVPSEGYDKDVLIGELLDDPWDLRSITSIDGDDGEFVYVGRRVVWRAARPKRFFSQDMITALHTQTALFQVARSLHEEVYRLAYKNFVYRDGYVAEFHTSKQHFTSEDSAVLSAWLNGFDYLRYVLGQDSASNLPLHFYEMALAKVPDECAADLTININSPGAFVLKSRDAFALALMALLPLSGCSSQEIIDNGVEVELKTVGSANYHCAVKVEDEIRTYSSTLSYNRLGQSCELGARAVHDAKVTTGADLQ